MPNIATKKEQIQWKIIKRKKNKMAKPKTTAPTKQQQQK